MIRFHTFLSIAICISLSCEPELRFSDAPVIELAGISKNEIKQNFLASADSIIFDIYITDGDGDFGFNQTDTSLIHFIDTRMNFEYTYRIPPINAEGSIGVEGNIRVKTGSLCCIYPDGEIPCSPNPNHPIDTLRYEIFVTDLAGNRSNVLLSPEILILCQ